VRSERAPARLPLPRPGTEKAIDGQRQLAGTNQVSTGRGFQVRAYKRPWASGRPAVPGASATPRQPATAGPFLATNNQAPTYLAPSHNWCSPVKNGRKSGKWHQTGKCWPQSLTEASGAISTGRRACEARA
jgi:hypothetical protein